MNDNILNKLLTGIFGSSTTISERDQSGVIQSYTKQNEPSLLKRLTDLIKPEYLSPVPKTERQPGISEFPTPQINQTMAGYTSRLPSIAEEAAKPYLDAIIGAAQKYEMPDEILYNLLARESMRFNPDVISGNLNSPKGAMGIAQFMPETADWWSNSYGKFDPLVAEQAIPAAASYLRYLNNQFQDWPQTLAAYNAGEGNVRKYGGIPPFKETEDYVKAILEGVEY